MAQTKKVANRLSKIEILFFIFRLLIISIAAIGIFLPTENSFLGQFWFFTLQTTLFVVILMTAKIVFQILKFFGREFNFFKSTIFSYFQTAVTFYITITGVIFCFVLAPVALLTNSAFISSLKARDILLHIFVPLLTIIEYYVCEEKTFLRKRSALLFLIYPVVYVLLAFARAAIFQTAFPGGSKYPYFFIDPTFNGQGWSMVAFYCALFLLSFYFLGLLYIFINNKLIKKRP